MIALGGRGIAKKGWEDGEEKEEVEKRPSSMPARMSQRYLSYLLSIKA